MLGGQRRRDRDSHAVLQSAETLQHCKDGIEKFLALLWPQIAPGGLVLPLGSDLKTGWRTPSLVAEAKNITAQETQTR